MQCILREKLLAQATKLAGISNIYRTESHSFVAAYFGWLEAAEKDLSGLRSPVSILLQAEKTSLTSVMDGYLPGYIESGKSLRKNQKAVAAQSLERVSREIYSKIETIDREFDELNEKLCHAVAVLASRAPEIYEALQADRHGIDTIWTLLRTLPETVPMYNYFSAKLNSTDRDYLLTDILQKVVSNRSPRAAGTQELEPGENQNPDGESAETELELEESQTPNEPEQGERADETHAEEEQADEGPAEEEQAYATRVEEEQADEGHAEEEQAYATQIEQEQAYTTHTFEPPVDDGQAIEITREESVLEYQLVSDETPDPGESDHYTDQS